MLTWLAIAAASAHPGSFRIAAHDVSVVVDDERVEIRYYLEAPRLGPENHDAPASDVVPDLSELQSGLILRLDGDAVTLTPLGDAGYRSSHEMAGVQATFTAPLPPGTRELTVENGNYPDLPGLFRNEWRLGADWRLTDSSLLTFGDERISSDASGRWIPGEDGRTSDVTLVRRARVEGALVPVSTSAVRATSTYRPGPLTAWRHAIPHPLWAAVVLLIAPLAGYSARLPADSSRVMTLAAGVGLGTCAAAVATVSAAGVPVAIGLAAVISAYRPLRWLGGWVALFGLASACPLWPWAIGVGVGGSFLARRSEPSRLDAVGVGLALVVGAMWALRLL